MTRLTRHAARNPAAFTPVPRKCERFDGWTDERQVEFIRTLAATGSLKAAAASVNMSESGAVALRKAPGAASFSRAWDKAIAVASGRIREVMVDHAINGVPEPVFFGGKLVGERRRFHTRAQQWLIERGEAAAVRVGLGTDRGQNPGPTREQMIKTRDRLATTLGKIQDAAFKSLAESIDTDDKRAAFEVLFGAKLHEPPWCFGTQPNVNTHAMYFVAGTLVNGGALLLELRDKLHEYRDIVAKDKAPTHAGANDASTGRPPPPQPRQTADGPRW